MFICEICKSIVPPSTPATRFVVETRNTIYPPRKETHIFRRNGRLVKQDDPGGRGTEIVKEMIVCPECARKQLFRETSPDPLMLFEKTDLTCLPIKH
jgi:rubredoxin